MKIKDILIIGIFIPLISCQSAKRVLYGDTPDQQLVQGATPSSSPTSAPTVDQPPLPDPKPTPSGGETPPLTMVATNHITKDLLLFNSRLAPDRVGLSVTLINSKGIEVREIQDVLLLDATDDEISVLLRNKESLFLGTFNRLFRQGKILKEFNLNLSIPVPALNGARKWGYQLRQFGTLDRNSFIVPEKTGYRIVDVVSKSQSQSAVIPLLPTEFFNPRVLQFGWLVFDHYLKAENIFRPIFVQLEQGKILRSFESNLSVPGIGGVALSQDELAFLSLDKSSAVHVVNLKTREERGFTLDRNDVKFVPTMVTALGHLFLAWEKTKSVDESNRKTLKFVDGGILELDASTGEFLNHSLPKIILSQSDPYPDLNDHFLSHLIQRDTFLFFNAPSDDGHQSLFSFAITTKEFSKLGYGDYATPDAIKRSSK